MTDQLRDITVDELAHNDPQTLADRLQAPVIWCDHQVTRRQRLHGVNIPNRLNAYTSTCLTEVLNHLAHEGYNFGIFIAETPRRTHLACQITFAPLGNDP
jgi:hypothetical protein